MKRYIQITSGRGPEECCFAVAQVLKKIIKDCKNHNCYHEVISREPSEINGNLHSAFLWIDTKNHPSLLDGWIGTVQWASESPFRPHHKRKNWFIGVSEVPQASMADLQEHEITYETFRSSGAGGQHVNKVSSGVRAIHKPTGLSVKVTDTRSQHQNKKLAKERLIRLWNEHQHQQIKTTNENNWINHLNVQRGNPVKVFKAKDFKLKSKSKKYRDKRGKSKQQWKREVEKGTKI